DLAGELRPLLETAQAARSIADDAIPNSAFHRSRSRILGKASQLRAQRKPKQFIFGRVPRMAMAALALALIFFMSWRGVIETARALPGDPFYPVKRSAQNIRMQIAPNPDTKRAIEVKYERQRVDEVMKLLRMGRITQVTFEGLLNERTPDRWIIEGIPVIVTPDTQVIGEIEEARVIEVIGKTQPDGEVEASQIRLHSYQLVGTVNSISPDKWVISDISLQIRRDSQIDPAARVKDQVIALVEVETSGDLQALAILRLLQPELIATPVPQETETPSVVITPEPKEIEITGVVASISGDVWMIDGRPVIITGDTEFKDSVSVGDHVQVHALLGADGSLTAREIEFDKSFQEDLKQNEDEKEEFKPEDNGGEHEGIEDSSGSDKGDDHNQIDDASSGDSGHDGGSEDGDHSGDPSDAGDHSGGDEGDHSGEEGGDHRDGGEEKDSYLGSGVQVAGESGEIQQLLFIF
ncbi:MAG: DUF5666 domain-containing protein, partial [Anaerolineales bacterium]